MYKHLLVPTDGSALSRRTIRDAAELARKLGARITGFYVAPTYHIEIYADYVPPDMMTPAQHAASAKKTAQSHLEFMRKTATEERIKCDGYFVFSDLPADEIVKAARKHKYDLIITPLRKYDLHRESSGIPDVLAVEETLDHMGLPLAAVQV